MSYTTALRWAIVTGLVLTLLVPFIIANGAFYPSLFFPFITGKNFTFRIIVEIIFALYILLALRDPKYRPRASTLSWTLLAFIAWMGITTIFSVDPVKSFWSNFERMDGYIGLIHLYAYFLVAAAVLTAERWWTYFLQISVGASGIMGIYALFQLAGAIPIDQGRLDGTLGNPAYLAVYMLFNFFFALYLLVRERRPVIQGLYIIALVLQLIAIYESETRGALLGLVAGLFVAAIFIAWQGREWKMLRRISGGALILLVISILGFILIHNEPFIRNSNNIFGRFASISLSDKTTYSRLVIWQEALQGIEEKPVLGWGLENFNFVFNKFYNPIMYDQEQWFDRAHNEFIDMTVAGGLPAFALYISLFALAASAIWKSDLLVPEKALWGGLLVGYAVNNLVVFDNLASAMYFFALLAFVHQFVRKDLPSRLWLARPMSERGFAVAAPLVFVVLAATVYYFNIPGIVRAETLISALNTQTSTGAAQDPAVNLQYFESALSDGQLGKQEVVEQLLQFASDQAASTSIDPSTKQQIFNVTQSAALSMMAQRQHDARIELFAGIFYDSFGSSYFPQAITYLKEALADSPGKQQILFELGQIYLQEGDVGDALPLLQQAYTEDTAYDMARDIYVAALYYAGENAQGDALLQQRYGTVIVDDNVLLQAYTDTKQYQRVVAIWQLRVTNNPQDVDDYLGLANAYFSLLHDNTDAIAELQKVAQIDPSLATQVQQVISQIQSGTLKP